MKLLYNDFSVIMGLVYFQLPYMIINVYVSLDGIDRNLESAARTLRLHALADLPRGDPAAVACRAWAPAACCVSCWRPAPIVTPRLLGGTDTLFFPDLIYDAIICQLDWPTGAVLVADPAHAPWHRGLRRL